MIFSSNMEYDDGDVQPIQGAFYASPPYQEPKFNYFREEVLNLTASLEPLSEEAELKVLKDNRQDFYLDLLFYHWKLRCYLVIELSRPGTLIQCTSAS